MIPKPTKTSALLDIGLVAGVVAFLAVLINRHEFTPAAYTALNVLLLLGVNAIAWWREARKERQLDELELASASFGARWSMAVVGIAPFLILFFAPLQQAIVRFAHAYEGNEGGPLPPAAGVFLCGFVVAIFIQLAAKSALGAIWTWTKR